MGYGDKGDCETNEHGDNESFASSQSEELASEGGFDLLTKFGSMVGAVDAAPEGSSTLSVATEYERLFNAARERAWTT